jgi:hypothetical protein
MKFTIEGRVYNAADLDLVSLKDILLLAQQTRDLGRPLTWGELGAMSQALDGLASDAERERHPDAPWILAVTIWATRRIAGEDLSFGDAIDFPMRELKFLPEPQDRKAPVNPTKARTGSVRAAKSRPAVAAAPEPGSTPTSEEASISA